MINVLSTHVPPLAVDYCELLWKHYSFLFRVAKPRQSRLGDFRALLNQQTQITVNANLNVYAFLITYIHEVAHADVHQQYIQQQRTRRVKPHGRAWQSAFHRLMQPLMNEQVFPQIILQPLRHYMTKPAATTYANSDLMIALRQFDTIQDITATNNRVLLRNVLEGNTFKLAQKMFVRGTLRRTRVVCKEVVSGKSYAILAHAWVEINE